MKAIVILMIVFSSCLFPMSAIRADQILGNWKLVQLQRASNFVPSTDPIVYGGSLGWRNVYSYGFREDEAFVNRQHVFANYLIDDSTEPARITFYRSVPKPRKFKPRDKNVIHRGIFRVENNMLIIAISHGTEYPTAFELNRNSQLLTFRKVTYVPVVGRIVDASTGKPLIGWNVDVQECGDLLMPRSIHDHMFANDDSFDGRVHLSAVPTDDSLAENLIISLDYKYSNYRAAYFVDRIMWYDGTWKNPLLLYEEGKKPTDSETPYELVFELEQTSSHLPSAPSFVEMSEDRINQASQLIRQEFEDRKHYLENTEIVVRQSSDGRIFVYLMNSQACRRVLRVYTTDFKLVEEFGYLQLPESLQDKSG